VLVSAGAGGAAGEYHGAQISTAAAPSRAVAKIEPEKISKRRDVMAPQQPHIAGRA
jgi:hypothetical protein